MLRENFRLSLQVQERAQQRVDHSNASDIPFPPTNTLPGQSNQPELDAQIEEKKNALAQLKDSLFHGQLQLEALQKEKEEISIRAPIAMRKETPLPVLILCYNRADYLRQTLDNILANRPSAEQFPIIVSQDGSDEQVWNLVNSVPYRDQIVSIQFKERGKLSTPYHYIAQHFKFAISTVLDKLQYDDVVIVEDDMKIAPDFLTYFQRMRHELYADDSLYVASAWNDNGQYDHGRDPKQLKRSDFFPGLGWIMTGKLWNEFREKWPEGYWDDWMRLPEQRKGRHCIFPEISRSSNFGATGSSGGQFWSQFIKPVPLYEGAPIPWKEQDLSYLQEEKWRAALREKLRRGKEISSPKEEETTLPKNLPVIITYKNDSDFDKIAKQFTIMPDEKSGIHRTAFDGVIYFWKGDREIIIADQNYKKNFDI